MTAGELRPHPPNSAAAATRGLVDEDKFLRAGAGFIILFVAGVVLKLARPVLLPFLLALFLSYLIDPALTFLAKCRCPRPWAVPLVLLFLFVLLILLGALFYSSGKSFAGELPRYQGRLGELAGLLQRGVGPVRFDVSAALEKLDFGRAAAVIVSALGPFLVLVGNLLLVFLFLAVIVSGRGRGAARLRKALGESRSGQVAAVLSSIDGQIRKYLVIKTALSLANGLTVWLVLALFGVDFAPLFGVLAFFLNFIPNIGSFISTTLRVGFAFFQFGTFWTPFWIFVITSGLDAVAGYFIEPRIMGRGLGLSPLLVFFSLLFWGWLWGIPGMILSVPLTAVIKIICQNVPGLRPVAVLMGS